MLVLSLRLFILFSNLQLGHVSSLLKKCKAGALVMRKGVVRAEPGNQEAKPKGPVC